MPAVDDLRRAGRRAGLGLSPDELRRLERLLPVRPVPWRVGDLYGVVLANVVGFAFVAVAWYAGHNTTDPDHHAIVMNVAVAGLVVALAGNVVWLLTGLREVGALRRSLLGITAADEARPAVRQALAGAPLTTTATGALVATKEMTRYHRADCLLVADKPVAARSLRQHVAAGRRPCGVCRPDEVAT